VLDFEYCFNTSVTDFTQACTVTPVLNNGNVVRIKNNRVPDRSQRFTYDALNRIATARTQATTGPHCWGETFGYDIWANLLSIGGIQPTYNGCTQENLGVTVTTKNQLSGYCYDAAGNLVLNSTCPQPPGTPFTPTYSYDAENRMTATAGVTYTYDGDGKRVKKSNGKLYWYGMSSDALLETDAAGNTPMEFIFFGGKRIARRNSGGAVSYFFADHLGTSRVVTNATGGSPEESDFYPFGGERVVTDTLPDQNYKFTGKERDTESGLDYFGARHYAGGLGRFLSPDRGRFQSWDPQTLNRYSYVTNNPLKYVDPDGNFREAVHRTITIGVLTRLGYAVATSRAIADRNIHVDNCCNNAREAFKHSQVGTRSDGTWQTLAEAQAAQREWVRTNIDDAASAVISGDFAKARDGLGAALHAVQDEKHDWIRFDRHSGAATVFTGVLRGDREAQQQNATDVTPTPEQEAAARRRSEEVISSFEHSVRTRGALGGMTHAQVEELLYEFRNQLNRPNSDQRRP
jgi:RHS repeat-associated protein